MDRRIRYRNTALALAGALLVGMLLAHGNVYANMPPHGPYEKGCHPDTTHAQINGGITVAFDCFNADLRLDAMYGVRFQFAPTQERYSNGSTTTSSMKIYLSADPSCSAIRTGKSIPLNNSCLLIAGSIMLDKGLGYVNTCAFKSKSPLVLGLTRTTCMFNAIAGKTRGSMIFTHWSTREGTFAAIRFSPDAQITEFISDPNGPNGQSQVAMPLSGAADIRIL